MRRAWMLALLVACTPKSQASTTDAAPSASAPAASAAPSATAAPSASGWHASVLPFVENDYPRALAVAKSTGRPIFVDTWALWCHSCMSMREYVFTDARLAAMKDKFVWLAIDSEQLSNSDFLTRFPSTSLPTLWVIDPMTEKPSLKWIGAATAAELEALLDDATAGASAGGDAMAAFVRGNQATGAGKPEEAVAEYKKSLAASPPEWKRRPAVVEALTMRLNELRRHPECVDLAAAEAPKLPPGTSQSNVLQNGLMSAYALPPKAPSRAKVPPLLALAQKIVGDPSYPFLADDRSGLYEHVVNILHDTDPAGAKNAARQWALFLEGQAKNAASPAARAVWDPHRLLAYVELGEVEKAIPMLEETARDFPDDYNPHARLARAHLALKHLDEAKASVDRALAKAYGPRKLQIYMLASDIHTARGDAAAARKAITDAIDEANAMRLPPKYARIREELDRRLASLKG